MSLSKSKRQCSHHKKYVAFLCWLLLFVCYSSMANAQDTLNLQEVLAKTQKLTISQIVDSIKNNIQDKYALPTCMRVKGTTSLIGIDTIYYQLSDSAYMNYFSTYSGWKYEGYFFSAPQAKRPFSQIDNTNKKQRLRGVRVRYSILENPIKSIQLYLDSYKGEEARFSYIKDTSGVYVDLLWFTANKIIWNRGNEGTKEDKDTATVVVDFFHLVVNRENWVPMLVRNGAIEISTEQYENAKKSFPASINILDSVLKEKSANQLVITSRFELNNQGRALLNEYEVSDDFSPVSFGNKFIGRVRNPERSTWRLKIEGFKEIDSPQIALRRIDFEMYYPKEKNP